MGVTAKHLYRRGDMINTPKLRSPRVAKRHYACVLETKCHDSTGVASWLANTVRLLDAQPDLVGLMRAGMVEATIWITTLISDPPLPPVRLDPALVRAAVATGAEILVED